MVAEVKELAREHTAEAIHTLVSIMNDPKSVAAARVSASNSLLDRGYGKPPQHQHITGEDGPRFVALLPEPCKTVEEWEASLGGLSSQQSNVRRLSEVRPHEKVSDDLLLQCISEPSC